MTDFKKTYYYLILLIFSLASCNNREQDNEQIQIEYLNKVLITENGTLKNELQKSQEKLTEMEGIVSDLEKERALYLVSKRKKQKQIFISGEKAMEITKNDIYNEYKNCFDEKKLIFTNVTYKELSGNRYQIYVTYKHLSLFDEYSSGTNQYTFNVLDNGENYTLDTGAGKALWSLCN